EGNHVGRDAEDPRQILIAHDTHPSDTEAFGARGEPQVLDREAGGIDLDVAQADLAEDTRPEALRLACHDEVERRLEDALELEREEFFAARPFELLRIFRTLFLEDALHFAAALEVAHD